MRAVAAIVLLAACASASIAASRARDPSLPTVELTVQQPAQPFLHNTEVTVSWQVTSGTVDPELDYVSSWWTPFPATYVQYFNVSAAQGSVTFSLLNARHPYAFRYYRNNTLVAEAAEQVAPDATYPMGVRAIFQGTPENDVTIMWTSNRSLGEGTAVVYGFSADALTMVAPVAKSVTYTAKELNDRLQLPPIARRTTPFENLGKRDLRCGWEQCYNDFTANELFVEPGLQHVAYLRNLAPGTRYFYRVGEPGGHLSAVRSFQTKVAPGPNASLQVLYVADAGAGYQTDSYRGGAAHNAVPIPPAFATDGARLVWDSVKADPEFKGDVMSIMNGDISYARGWPLIWELFHNETEDIFGTAPVLPSIGNHEFDFGHNPFTECDGGDSGGEAGIPTVRRFNFESLTTPWYYVANGPAFFIALSSEHDPIEQSIWLRNVALKAFDRRVTPWLIVFLHRPLYESNTFDSRRLTDMLIESYTDLWNEYGVDMVLTGHAHYYERLCAISSSHCNTWGYRDVWTSYIHTKLTDMSCATKGASTDYFACRVECAKQQSCTGITFNYSSNTCYTLTCAQPLSVEYEYGSYVYNLERKPGRSPVYVVDGTAGGVFAPASTPFSPLTEYKDFLHWGYSRLRVNSTTLSWHHHHIDGSVVDQVTIDGPNPAN